jgi:hypothetical protein
MQRTAKLEGPDLQLQPPYLPPEFIAKLDFTTEISVLISDPMPQSV